MIAMIAHSLKNDVVHVAVRYISDLLASLDQGVLENLPTEKEWAELRALAPDVAIKAKHRSNVVSVASLVTLLEMRVRCETHDQEWYEEDRLWRTKPTTLASHMVFKEAAWADTPLTFFGEHPRYAYKASMVLKNMSEIYLADTIDNVAATFMLYEMLLDRAALLLVFPHADAIDVAEYGLENGHATSAFLWDVHHLTNGIRKMRALANAAPDYNPKWTDIMQETKASRDTWLAGMVITAAGDDLMEFFKVYYLEATATDVERQIFLRSHGTKPTGYDVMKEFRGIERANAEGVHADTFISELIRLDDDGMSAEEYDQELRSVVLARVVALPRADHDMLLCCCLSYAVTRLVELDFDKYVLGEKVQKLPWGLGWMCEEARFETLSEAFVAFLFPIMKNGGTTFHPESKALLKWDKVAKGFLGL
jgi:hypothetical protein